MIAELKIKDSLQHNQSIVDDIIEDWKCIELEAWAALEYDTVTLEDTQFAIAQGVTYNRLMKTLPIENEHFLREEYYKGKQESKCKNFIKSEAKEMAEEQA